MKILGRILALDYGTKRTGVAVTDPLQMIANSLETVRTFQLLEFIEGYLAREMVDVIVLGYPRQMNNEPSDTVPAIEALAKKLRNKYPNIPVEFADERFTSKLAQQTMIMGGVKKKDRQNKGLVDSISAAIILQSYLERRQNMLMKK
jgi:putative Holliday junction resolvase